MQRIILLAVVLLLAPGCKEPPPPSPEALSYLNRALDIMEQNSLRRDSVDWKSLRARIVNRSRGAQGTKDLDQPLRYALASLGDRHSTLATPEQAEAWKTGRGPATRTGQVRFELLFSHIAYVSVPAFASGEDSTIRVFATRIQHSIAMLDSAHPCGWIIDVRNNQGGNMWPMMAGLGPLLGEGEIGSFVGARGHRRSWWYKRGRAGLDTATLVVIAGSPYGMRQPDSPVAVLTGENTSSSGEAVVVAFRGRPATRSFGTGTCGRSTANELFLLPDGAMLVLTTAVFADRTGRAYGGVLEPDEVIPTKAHASLRQDPVVQAAVSWLRAQLPCSHGPTPGEEHR